MRVRVTAPASTANLGPGFDCLGGALSVALEVSVGAAEGEGDSSLAAKAVAAVPGAPPAVRIEVHSGFPSGCGLGFSASEVAVGLLAGCALAGRDPDPGELLELGTPLEGHPDNLAATLYGGITLVLPAGGGVFNFRPAASVRPVILLPREKLATSKARAALPSSVPRTDAVANIARAGGLLALLNGSAPVTAQTLLSCTEDLLHQPYRAPLMPRTEAMIGRLRAGGVAAALSGAGPSVVCLVTEETEARVRPGMKGNEDWRVMNLDWDLEGARILS